MDPIVPVAPAPPPVGPPGIPMVDQIDPLTGLPMGPPAPPPPLYGNQMGPQGLPWPPEAWGADPNAQPPPEAAQTASALPPPSVLSPSAPEARPEVAPVEPTALQQAGPQGMAAMDQAHMQGAQPIDPYPGVKGKAAPPLPPMDPYLAHLAQSEREHGAADMEVLDAQKAGNEFARVQGMEAAAAQDRARMEGEKEYVEVQRRATAKRQELDQEAIKIANTHVDSRRAWHNADFGTKIAIGVAAMFSAPMANGQNSIVNAVNGICEQDMKAQEIDIQTRQTALGTRRGLLADDLAAGKDMLDFRYKSYSAAYEIAGNQIKAQMLKYDNDVLTAKGHQRLVELSDAKWDAGEKYVAEKKKAYQLEQQQKTANWLASRQVAVSERHQKMLEDAAKAKAEGDPVETSAMMNAKRMGEQYRNGLIIRGSDGAPIGEGKTEKETEQANQVVIHRKSLNTLYERGRELFKDDWAAPGTKLRSQQDAWNKNWAQERRAASGDLSAPNIRDQEIWGLDTGRMIGDNMDTLVESYDNAINLGRGVLEHSAVDADTLKREGFIKPPPAPTPGVTSKLLFEDEQGNVSDDSTGRPLSEDETKAWMDRKAKFEKNTTKLDIEEWKYRRSQNNLHVQQNRKGPMPFPDVGVGGLE